MSWDEDIAICRRMLRGGSKTFFAASKVLPRSVGDPAIALYAFCREADDAIDGPGRRVDAVEVATGVDHGGAQGLGAPQKRAILLERGHRDDGGLEHGATRSLSVPGPRI